MKIIFVQCVFVDFCFLWSLLFFPFPSHSPRFLPALSSPPISILPLSSLPPPFLPSVLIHLSSFGYSRFLLWSVRFYIFWPIASSSQIHLILLFLYPVYSTNTWFLKYNFGPLELLLFSTWNTVHLHFHV